jgi:hydrogenase nickel incorporation protein HypA/HybF
MLIEQVAQEVAAAGRAGCVKRLDLSIGCFSGVNVDSLQFAFELLAPGTLVEGAQLAIAEPRAQGHCQDCGARFETVEFVPCCARCTSGNVRISGGQEMILESIELEEGK